MTHPSAEVTTGWPQHLCPGALRFARSSGRYDETIRFYRDLVGLPVLDVFTASFDEDGTVFGLPTAGTELEIVRRDEDDQRPALDQLVLYLDDADAVGAATSPLREKGLTPDPDPHPYWRANGAVLFRDPDGRAVVFAPWVYGRDPDPIEQDPGRHTEGGQPPAAAPPVDISEHRGDRSTMRWLFEYAEDSASQLDDYVGEGDVLVARQGGAIVGHLQLVPAERDGEVEVKNMAVVPDQRGSGVGRALVATALTRSRSEGLRRVLVATAAADVGNLRFYQRCGFRFASIERDAFTPETGYPDPIFIDRIPLRDRVVLSQDL